jgi:hypothetical protein
MTIIMGNIFNSQVRIAVFLYFLVIGISSAVNGQPLVRRALFLGNSYTYVNNLPILTAALAQASGDSLFFDSNAPGGYTLGWQPVAHATDPVSLAKIQGSTWDFVILQEQSQTPAIGRLRDSCMYPASVILHNVVKSVNPCSRVLFFLTWGRRFGGIQCFEPNYCSPDFTGFNQMQDSITMSYKVIADSLSDWIAPVGEAWRFVINHSGMVLHDADNSHPNLKGSYLAACVFYGVIFQKPSAGNSFTAGLAPDSALMLQQVADSITFGYSQQWNLNNDAPHAAFSLTSSHDTVFTRNLSSGSDNWLWDFGDGQTSVQFEPYHVYPGSGTWMVKLRACNSCFCDSTDKNVTISTTGLTTGAANGQLIRLLGPDQDGLIKLLNFHEDGLLTLYEITGKLKTVLPVKSGIAKACNLSKGLWIWTISNTRNELVGRGLIYF